MSVSIIFAHILLAISTHWTVDHFKGFCNYLKVSRHSFIFLKAMDIDDILESAETRDSENQPSTVGDDLLSQFKVANFGIGEEDDEMETKTDEVTEDEAKDDDKTWDEIIPEAERKKAVEEEEQKKRMELYLPPRKRKAVTKVALISILTFIAQNRLCENQLY